MADFQGFEAKQPAAGTLRGHRKHVIVAGLTCLSALLLSFVLYGPLRSDDGHSKVALSMEEGRPAPALTLMLPPTVPAAQATIADDARVIGIEIGGHHRAYCISALAENPALHVVEDRVGRSPVCVTYCPLGGCTKVFARDAGPLLEVTLGGLSGVYHHMLLRVGRQRYDQTTLMPLNGSEQPFPYASYPYLVTTWGQWRQAHPDTDAYAGAS